MIEHDGCKGCKYEHETPHSQHCQYCTQNAIDKYTIKTNADHIRTMSDEELAVFLGEFVTCKYCEYNDPELDICGRPCGEKCDRTVTTRSLMRWLQKMEEEK